MANNLQDQLIAAGLVDPGNAAAFGPVVDMSAVEALRQRQYAEQPPLFPIAPERDAAAAPLFPADAARSADLEARGWMPSGASMAPVNTTPIDPTPATAAAAAALKRKSLMESLSRSDFAAPGDAGPAPVRPPPPRSGGRRGDDKYAKMTTEAYDAQKQAAQMREEYEVTKAADDAAAAQMRIDYLDQERRDSLDRAEETRKAKAATEAKLSREIEFASTNVDRGTFDEWANKLDDPATSDEERSQIQRKLQASKEIDPTAYLGKTQGQKVVVGIMMAIAQSMGAYGAALGRAPNYAAQIIEAGVNRSIDAQKDLFAKKRGALADRKQIYGRMLAAYDGDEEKADAAAKAASYEMVKQRIAGMAAKAGGQEAQLKAQETIAIVDAAKAKELARLHDLDEKRRLDQRKIDAMRRAAGPKPDKSRAATVETARMMRIQLERMRQIRKDAGALGFEAWDQSLVRRGQVAAKDFMGQYNRLRKFGALDRGTQEIMDEMIPKDPTALSLLGGIEGQLAGLEDILNDIEAGGRVADPGGEPPQRVNPYGFEEEEP